MKFFAINPGRMLLFVFVSPQIFACTCAGINDKKSFEEADFVYIGKIIRIEIDDKGNATAILTPNHIYKGIVGFESPIYKTRTSCATSFLLFLNQDYIVYGKTEKKTLISDCTDTRLLTDNERYQFPDKWDNH